MGSYTFGGYAEASWAVQHPDQYGRDTSGTASNFIFRLGPGAAATYRPTGANTDYQRCSPGYWPEWGNDFDLRFGRYGVLGHDGRCDQGTTYAGAPNAACGGSGNWGATEMEVWYPVP